MKGDMMPQPANRTPTGEIIGNTTKKGIFILLLGTLIVALLANFLAMWYVNDYPRNLFHIGVKAKWEMILDRKEPADWLILGDSSGLWGAVPSVIDERLGVSSINLCTFGGFLAQGDAWMLQKYIELLGPPKGILIVHTPFIWHRNDIPASNVAMIPLEWGELMRLEPQPDLSTIDMIRLASLRFAPLYSQSRSLSSAISNPWNMFESRFALEEDGLHVGSKPDPENVKESTERYMRTLRARESDLSVTNREALERIAALAEQYDFDVYVANGAVYEGLLGDADFTAYVSRLQEQLGGLAAGSERMHYVLGEPMAFAGDQMENATHLIYPAALVYTDRLATEILSIKQAAE